MTPQAEHESHLSVSLRKRGEPKVFVSGGEKAQWHRHSTTTKTAQQNPTPHRKGASSLLCKTNLQFSSKGSCCHPQSDKHPMLVSWALLTPESNIQGGLGGLFFYSRFWAPQNLKCSSPSLPVLNHGVNIKFRNILNKQFKGGRASYNSRSIRENSLIPTLGLCFGFYHNELSS